MVDQSIITPAFTIDGRFLHCSNAPRVLVKYVLCKSQCSDLAHSVGSKTRVINEFVVFEYVFIEPF